MKKIITLVLIFASFHSPAQQADKDRQAVQEKIDLFFKVLETKDTSLYKTLVFTGGQIWTVRRVQDSLKNSTRFFSDDMKSLVNSKDVIEERALNYEIKIHKDIAIAWVPYTLKRSGKFSHCGVDIFTLLKTTEGWRIVNASYSVEPDGCADLKKNYN